MKRRDRVVGRSRPNSLIAPASRRTRPSNIRIAVVFPAPFGPRNP
jgi:hypothetical protein